MGILPKYTIDTEDGTSKLDLYINNIYITSYVYENEEVTLLERPNTDEIRINELDSNITAIGIWQGMVAQYLKIVYTKLRHFNLYFEKKSNKLETKLILNDVKLTDSKYENSTGMIEFKPRIEQTVTFSEFVMWYRYLKIYSELIKEF